jgi:hypothetical protein
MAPIPTLKQDTFSMKCRIFTAPYSGLQRGITKLLLGSMGIIGVTCSPTQAGGGCCCCSKALVKQQDDEGDSAREKLTETACVTEQLKKIHPRPASGLEISEQNQHLTYDWPEVFLSDMHKNPYTLPHKLLGPDYQLPLDYLKHSKGGQALLAKLEQEGRAVLGIVEVSWPGKGEASSCQAHALTEQHLQENSPYKLLDFSQQGAQAKMNKLHKIYLSLTSLFSDEEGQWPAVIENDFQLQLPLYQLATYQR